MTDSDTIRRIRRELRSPDAQVRAECVEALVALADIRGLRSAMRSPDPYVRARATRALAAVRGIGITWRLTRLRLDADIEVRCVVARALAQRRGWWAARTLAQLARDRHPVVRYTALTGLARNDWDRARAMLQSAMTSDEEGWVRDAAATLLERHGLGAHGAAPL